MGANDMEHMNFIDVVRQQDIDTLREKERTYQGSWKKAGGRSAWFMARRNMDRLIAMMAQPTEPPVGFNLQNVDDTIDAVDRAHGKMSLISFPGSPQATVEILKHLRDSYVAEDIFAKIGESPDGSDGTVLACVRDLRCYLTLVEAEMMSRGVVPTTTSSVPLSKTQEISVENTVTLDSGPFVSGGKIMGTLRRVPRYDTNEEPYRPGTPEDGGHHEKHSDLFPWELTREQYDKIINESNTSRKDALVKFYKQISADLFRLEAVVDHHKIPMFLNDCYEYIFGRWLLTRRLAPEEMQDCWPRLQTEMTVVEYEQSPIEYRSFYVFDNKDGKHKLDHEIAVNWGR